MGAQNGERVIEARRLFAEHGIEELDRLDEWNGQDVEQLREALTEEEFQLLLDGLQDWDERQNA